MDGDVAVPTVCGKICATLPINCNKTWHIHRNTTAYWFQWSNAQRKLLHAHSHTRTTHHMIPLWYVLYARERQPAQCIDLRSPVMVPQQCNVRGNWLFFRFNMDCVKSCVIVKHLKRNGKVLPVFSRNTVRVHIRDQHHLRGLCENAHKIITWCVDTF